MIVKNLNYVELYDEDIFNITIDNFKNKKF